MSEKRNLATVAHLPFKDGDGYSYGGHAILVIGAQALDLGAGREATTLAVEIARRWNAVEEAPRDDE